MTGESDFTRECNECGWFNAHDAVYCSLCGRRLPPLKPGQAVRSQAPPSPGERQAVPAGQQDRKPAGDSVPRPQYKKNRAKRVKPPMSLMRGGVSVAGTVLAACFVVWLLFFSFYRHGFSAVNNLSRTNSPLADGIIYFSIAVLGASFLAGLRYKKGGWLLGIVIGLFFVCCVVPPLRSSYSGDFTAGTIASFVILGLSPFAAELGCRINKAAPWSTRELKWPYLSLLAPFALAVTILVSYYGLKTTDSNRRERSTRTLVQTRQAFEVVLMKGWRFTGQNIARDFLVSSSEGASRVFRLNGVVEYDESKLPNDIPEDQRELYLSVFDTLPYSDTNVGSFLNESACYTELVSSLNARHASGGGPRTVMIGHRDVGGRRWLQVGCASPSGELYDGGLYLFTGQTLYRLRLAFFKDVKEAATYYQAILVDFKAGGDLQ